MKLNKILAYLTILFMATSSCQDSPEEAPSNQPEVFLTDVLRTSIELSLNEQFYSYSNGKVEFDNYRFTQEINTKLGVEIFPKQGAASYIYPDIDQVSRGPNSIDDIYPEEYLKFRDRIHSLITSSELTGSNNLFDDLGRLSSEIFDSNLKEELKIDLFAKIEFGYVAFHVVSELSAEGIEPVKSNIAAGIHYGKTIVSSNSDECGIDWDSILDSTLQGVIFGAAIGSVVGTIGGGITGLGILTPLTAPAGAIAGATMGAIGGATEEFMRNLAWEGLKYLWCKLAKSN